MVWVWAGVAGEAVCRAPCLAFAVGWERTPPEPQLLLQHTALPQHRAGPRAARSSPVQLRAVLSVWGPSGAPWWVRARVWGVPCPAGLDWAP